MSADPIEPLRRLAAELENRRFAVRLHRRENRPAMLSVVNSAAPALSESVMTAPDADGRLSFWFPWPALICPVSDVVSAANQIERVLAEVGRPRSR